MSNVPSVRQIISHGSDEYITNIIDYLMSNLKLESEIEDSVNEELTYQAEVSEFDVVDVGVLDPPAEESFGLFDVNNNDDDNDFLNFNVLDEFWDLESDDLLFIDYGK